MSYSQEKTQGATKEQLYEKLEENWQKNKVTINWYLARTYIYKLISINNIHWSIKPSVIPQYKLHRLLMHQAIIPHHSYKPHKCIKLSLSKGLRRYNLRYIGWKCSWAVFGGTVYIFGGRPPEVWSNACESTKCLHYCTMINTRKHNKQL